MQIAKISQTACMAMTGVGSLSGRVHRIYEMMGRLSTAQALRVVEVVKARGSYHMLTLAKQAKRIAGPSAQNWSTDQWHVWLNTLPSDQPLVKQFSRLHHLVQLQSSMSPSSFTAVVAERLGDLADFPPAFVMGIRRHVYHMERMLGTSESRVYQEIANLLSCP